MEKRFTDYELEVWAERESEHNGGWFGEVEEMRELDRYELAHTSRDLSCSVVDSD